MRQRIEIENADPANAADAMRSLLTGLGASSRDFRVNATGGGNLEIILEGDRWDAAAVERAMAGIQGEGYRAHFLGLVP